MTIEHCTYPSILQQLQVTDVEFYVKMQNTSLVAAIWFKYAIIISGIKY